MRQNNTNYIKSLKKTSKILLFLSIVWLCSSEKTFAQYSIQGNAIVTVGNNQTYTISGGSYYNVYWNLSGGGTITSTSPLGSATIQWNTTGSYTLSALVEDAFGGLIQVPNFTISVNPACPSTPNVVSTAVSGFAGCPIALQIQSPQAGITYRWYSVATRGTTLGTGTSYNYTNATAGTYMLYAAAFDGTCESTPRRAITVTVNAFSTTTAPTISTPPLGGFINRAITLSVLNPISGVTYEWLNSSSTVIGTGTSFTFTPTSSATPITYRVRAKACASVIGTASTATNIPIYPNPLTITSTPTATAGIVLLGQGQRATLTLGITYIGATYQWQKQNSNNTWSNIIGATAISYSPPAGETGKYQLLVTIGSQTVSSNELVVKKGYQATDMNYIISNTVLKDNVKNVADIDALAVGELVQSITYFDGLGRPIQSVATQASPNGKDIISPVVYDAFGRTPKSYMPYTKGSTGAYRPLAVTINYPDSEQAKFYNPTSPITESPANIAKDIRPFSETIFEASPLNRPLKQYGVGDAWAPGPNKNDKFVESKFEIYQQPTAIASPDRVKIWEFNYTSKTFALAASPDYLTGSLIITEIIDEDGSRVRQFIDKQGQVILKQAFGDGTDILETYYVYDDFGQLRGVIPPMAVAALKGNGWSLTVECPNCKVGVSVLEAYCYVYHYDSRGRPIEIKEPQTQPKYIAYDALDRPVATQDGNLRTENKWTFTKYDVLGRPVITGLITFSYTIPGVPKTREDVQTLINTHFANTPIKLYEVRQNGSTHGYTQGNAFPVAVTGVTVEVLTVSYYDDYGHDLNGDGTVNSTDLGNKTYQVFPDYHNGNFTRLRGAVTGSKVKVLDNLRYTAQAKWLVTVPYYDDRGRVIQVHADNHLVPTGGGLGKDVLNAKYSYVRLEEDHLKHTGGTYDVNVTQRYIYDFIGRPLKLFHQTNYNNQTYQDTLARYSYNELGQVIKKIVGTNQIQEMDYTYHIRGWLKKINDAELSNSKDLFGYELFYEDATNNTPTGTGLMQTQSITGTGLVGKKRFNGNIAGQKWKTTLDRQQRGYSYEYDKLNRLKEARYTNFSNLSSPERFSVYGMQYDLNGNIKALKRQGVVNITTPTVGTLGYNYGEIDNLTYQYNGNQLTKVTDGVTTSGVAGDFLDRATLPNVDEYTYDKNGNADRDDNKKISTIKYNHLGKSTEIWYKITETTYNTIKYTYDAVGIKLSKLVTEGSTTTQTDYVGGILYENYAIQFIATAEGKLLAPNQQGNESGSFAYQYQYTDHLGNLRMTFREAKEIAPFKATMEEANKNFEEREFANVAQTRTTKPLIATEKAAKLTTTQKIGPRKSIPVVQGDKIQAKAFAYYTTNSTTNTYNQLNVFINANPGYGSSTNAQGETQLAPFPLSNISVGVGITTAPPTQPAGVPNAYLALIHYNESGTVVGQQYIQISTLHKNTWANFLQTTDYQVTTKGRVEIYVANESNVDVYFDDLEIKHKGAIIAQEIHYDPWGLELVGIGKAGLDKFTFNAQSEKQKDLADGKGYFYETDFRGYDPALGRFFAPDPLAIKYPDFSPYAFVQNNPIMFSDPTGLDTLRQGSITPEQWKNFDPEKDIIMMDDVVVEADKDKKSDEDEQKSSDGNDSDQGSSEKNNKTDKTDNDKRNREGNKKYEQTNEHQIAMLFRSGSGTASTALKPIQEAFKRANVYSPGQRMDMKTTTVILDKKVKIPYVKKPIRIHKPLFEMSGTQAGVWSKRLNVASAVLGGVAVTLTVIDMNNNGITTSNSIDLTMATMATTGIGSGIAGTYFLLNTISIFTTGKDIGQHIDEASKSLTGNKLSDNVKNLFDK